MTCHLMCHRYNHEIYVARENDALTNNPESDLNTKSNNWFLTGIEIFNLERTLCECWLMRQKSLRTSGCSVLSFELLDTGGVARVFIMSLEEKFLAVLLLSVLCHLGHSRVLKLSYAFQNHKPNLAIYPHTREDTNLHKGSLEDSVVKEVNKHTMNSEETKSASRKIFRTAATNQNNIPPAYPPIDRNLLYSLGYIYLKDFLPLSNSF
ncbi:uncharacterized protein LOC143228348 [Tachypleus tridentatus]|uniref:uncharacterized protein LOC143228348 n=1 Tax=Tachypleus tridentatus TaxID=6853 RepID=UPI003FD45896